MLAKEGMNVDVDAIALSREVDAIRRGHFEATSCWFGRSFRLFLLPFLLLMRAGLLMGRRIRHGASKRVLSLRDLSLPNCVAAKHESEYGVNRIGMAEVAMPTHLSSLKAKPQ